MTIDKYISLVLVLSPAFIFFAYGLATVVNMVGGKQKHRRNIKTGSRFMIGPYQEIVKK